MKVCWLWWWYLSMVYSIKTDVSFFDKSDDCDKGDYRASLTRVWALFLYSEIFSGFISPPLGASWECVWVKKKVQASNILKALKSYWQILKAWRRKKTDKLELPGWFPTPVLCHGFLICRGKWKSNWENENEMIENCYLATNRFAKQNTGWVGVETWRKVGCFRRWSSF